MSATKSWVYVNFETTTVEKMRKLRERLERQTGSRVTWSRFMEALMKNARGKRLKC